MNKKLVLIALPAMLLASCGGAKQITLDEAKVVGKAIQASEITAAGQDEFTIITQSKTSIQASSSNVSGIGTLSQDSQFGAVIQYSRAEKYFHIEETSKKGTSEHWLMLSGEYFYELEKSVEGKKTGYKYPITAEEAAKFDLIKYIGGEAAFDSVTGYFFKSMLLALEDKEAEKANPAQGVTTEEKYYSNGDGHLIIDYKTTYAGGEYEGELNGVATGSAQYYCAWDKFLPTSFAYLVDVTVDVQVGGQTLTYKEAVSTSIEVAYGGTIISRPLLNSFTYLNVNED